MAQIILELEEYQDILDRIEALEEKTEDEQDETQEDETQNEQELI